MYQLLKDFLHQWNDNRNQRAKLQQAYFILVLALATLSGVISLINVDLSRTIVTIGAFIAAVYVANGVIWALLDAFVTPRIGSASKATRIKKR